MKSEVEGNQCLGEMRTLRGEKRLSKERKQVLGRQKDSNSREDFLV